MEKTLGPSMQRFPESLLHHDPSESCLSSATPFCTNARSSSLQEVTARETLHSRRFSGILSQTPLERPFGKPSKIPKPLRPTAAVDGPPLQLLQKRWMTVCFPNPSDDLLQVHKGGFLSRYSRASIWHILEFGPSNNMQACIST